MAVAPRPAHLAPNKNSQITAAALILEYLKGEGVSHVFGIPGGPITPLFDALYDEKAIQLISTRHEAGAAFMAAGYARLSGRLGVCLGTTGPGATNLITGLAAAAADSLPVLAITAQAATSTFGKGSLQDSTFDRVDIVEMFKSFTKMSAMAVNADNIPTLLRQAIRTAMSGRRGVTHLNIPTDLMKKKIRPELWPAGHYRSQERCFDREAARQACELLLRAKRPAILAGHGASLSGAQAEILELSELLNIPVATTPKGKGIFPETHPMSLRVFGLASSPVSESYLLSGVDVLFVIGSQLHEISTQGWEDRLRPSEALIQQDIDARSIGRNYPVEVALVGDAKTTLREIISQARKRLSSGEFFTPPRPDFERCKAAQPLWLGDEKRGQDSTPLKPQRLMAELQQALPEDAAVFVDSGNNTLWALHHLTATGRNAFLHNWGDFGAMGYGVASAIGGKLASPERPVVAIVGDGSFGMMGMEILTASTYGIPVIWIVLNDGRYNAVHHGQMVQYKGRTIGTEFKRMDLAKVAQALDVEGFRIEKPGEILEILPKVLASGRPAVLDVLIDPDELPPIESRFRSLEKFFFKN